MIMSSSHQATPTPARSDHLIADDKSNSSNNNSQHINNGMAILAMLMMMKEKEKTASATNTNAPPSEEAVSATTRPRSVITNGNVTNDAIKTGSAGSLLMPDSHNRHLTVMELVSAARGAGAGIRVSESVQGQGQAVSASSTLPSTTTSTITRNQALNPDPDLSQQLLQQQLSLAQQLLSTHHQQQQLELQLKQQQQQLKEQKQAKQQQATTSSSKTTSTSTKSSSGSSSSDTPQKKKGKIIRGDELGPYDCLVGRGTGPNENHGNRYYRQLIEQHKEEYNACKNRYLKDECCIKVLRIIQKKHGGKFYKMIRKGKRSSDRYCTSHENAGNNDDEEHELDHDVDEDGDTTSNNNNSNSNSIIMKKKRDAIRKKLDLYEEIDDLNIVIEKVRQAFLYICKRKRKLESSSDGNSNNGRTTSLVSPSSTSSTTASTTGTTVSSGSGGGDATSVSSTSVPQQVVSPVAVDPQEERVDRGRSTGFGTAATSTNNTSFMEDLLQDHCKRKKRKTTMDSPPSMFVSDNTKKPSQVPEEDGTATATRIDQNVPFTTIDNRQCLQDFLRGMIHQCPTETENSRSTATFGGSSSGGHGGGENSGVSTKIANLIRDQKYADRGGGGEEQQTTTVALPIVHHENPYSLQTIINNALQEVRRKMTTTLPSSEVESLHSLSSVAPAPATSMIHPLLSSNIANFASSAEGVIFRAPLAQSCVVGGSGGAISIPTATTTPPPSLSWLVTACQNSLLNIDQAATILLLAQQQQQRQEEQERH